MGKISRFINRQKGFFRRAKWVYIFFNLKHWSLLRKNKEKYKELGIKKPVFFSLQSSDFKQIPSHLNGIDSEDYFEMLTSSEKYLSYPKNVQDQIIAFKEDGFLILKGFFSRQMVNQINLEIEHLIKKGKIDFNFTGRKIAFAFKQSELLRRITLNNEILDLLGVLMGARVFPYHTLNFIQGSEQAPHSDAIHMSTYPQGGLIASWLALEATDADNGPLVYYPGSHKLPYLTNADLELRENMFLLDANPNLKYEEKIASLLESNGLQPKEFHAAPGDLLIWHGNLVHGGKKMNDITRTRKSMVVHYLREGSLCWHELSQRPALIEQINA